MSDIDTIAERADKFARIIMDQLEADRCGNLENVRNALVAPLMQAMLEDADAGAANCLAAPIEPPRSGPQPIPMPEVSAYMTRLRELTDGAQQEIRKHFYGEFADIRAQEQARQQFGISAEQARQAVIHAKAVGHPVLVDGHLDVIATPQGRITTDYQVIHDAERAHHQAKITTPVLARPTEEMRQLVRQRGLETARLRGHPIQTSIDLDEYAMPDGRIINGLQLIQETHKS